METEIKYDETEEVYTIHKDGKPLKDSQDMIMKFQTLDGANKWKTNLDMIILIYGDQ